MKRRHIGAVLAFALTAVAPAPRLALAQEKADGLRAVVRSANEATIGSDAGTRVLALPLKEGASFVKGDLLVVFDCARMRADFKAAQADAKAHAIAFQNGVALQKYHAAGHNEVLIARSEADKAEATAEGWAARVAQCEIRAPFDGSVADLFVHIFEMPSPTTPIIRIVDLAHLEIDMIVASTAASHVRIGDPFSLNVEETGQTVQGRVARIGAAIDPVSQTLKVVGTLDAKSGSVLPGMSGRAQFATMF